MKIAISGKGGVGKTTFAAILANVLAEYGYKVLAVDADPDSNLGQVLGVPNYEKIIPLTEMKELIKDRTNVDDNNYTGLLFKMNPTVYDLPDKFSVEYNGVRLMVMGAVKKGGGGCICPASSMLRALMSHLILLDKDVVILDMEAGLEHLGRATAKGVDCLVIVVEPGRRSVDTAMHIRKLAEDFSLSKIFIVGNKIRSQEDRNYLVNSLVGFDFLGFINYDESFINADVLNISPVVMVWKAKIEVCQMARVLFRLVTINN